ncbi:hypothetical protein Vadar_019947 [Vaccinium darrowii]|uniref:Uncharacterized protein n=1 Tax=Vaccinium darrowii TaxID=229202 RepID=A0ACB7Y7M2_9ERIC|nr:hypothetical protein Vadar_019947 [Vaccinium darrowii]
MSSVRTKFRRGKLLYFSWRCEKRKACWRWARLGGGGQPERASNGPMNVLVWNCQGLGNSRTVRRLLEVSNLHSPDCVFLVETKNKRKKMERIAKRTRFSKLWCVEPEGIAGIFTSSSPYGFDEVLNCVQRRVSPAMNARLICQVTAAEVKGVYSIWKPWKQDLVAPSMDGNSIKY